jgi:hypothetical protein
MAKLTAEERALLVEEIAEHTNSQREGLRQAKNWPQLQRYIGLIGLRSMLEAPWLEPRQINHVKKMAAIEAISINERQRRPPKASEFWQDIEEKIGAEMVKVRTYNEMGKLPRNYSEASRDLEMVDTLLENPLLIALRRSVKDTKQSNE